MFIYLILGLAVGYWMGKRRGVMASDAQSARVLALFGGGRDVTNDMVQKELGVSDATATRYLDALEKEGAIEQVGDTGRGVLYRKK